MYQPTSRVLTVLELLQSHSAISGPEIAARLEIDVRTVRRYITTLQDLGVPVEASVGRYGKYRLRPGFKLPPLMFTNDEVVTLTLGLMLARRLGLDNAVPAMEGAFAKLERVLPVALREQIKNLQQTLQIDVETDSIKIANSTLNLLTVAAQQERQVSLQYIGKDNEQLERIFDTYGVVYHAGRWYTAGYCHLRQDLRVFRLDRITSLRLTETKFSRPANFDCLNYVINSIIAIPDKWDVQVLLYLPLEEATKRIIPTLATLEQQPEGVLFHAIISDLDWLARYLIGLNCRFSVISPSELKTALEKIAQEIMASNKIMG